MKRKPSRTGKENDEEERRKGRENAGSEKGKGKGEIGNEKGKENGKEKENKLDLGHDQDLEKGKFCFLISCHHKFRSNLIQLEENEQNIIQ